MSVDLELLTVARNYAVKLEIEFKKAQKKWAERFIALDDELQSLYADKDDLYRKYQELREACLKANKAYELLEIECNLFKEEFQMCENTARRL